MQRMGVKVDDVKYLKAYEAYCNMRRMHVAMKQVYAFIRQEFGISRSNMQNIVERFEHTIDNNLCDYEDIIAGK